MGSKRLGERSIAREYHWCLLWRGARMGMLRTRKENALLMVWKK